MFSPRSTPCLPGRSLQLWVYRNGDVNSHLQKLVNITSDYFRTLSCNVFSGLEKEMAKRALKLGFESQQATKNCICLCMQIH